MEHPLTWVCCAAAGSWLHMLGVAGYTRDGMHREAYLNSHSKAGAGALPGDDLKAAAHHTDKDAAPYSKQYSAGPGRAQPYDTGVSLHQHGCDSHVALAVPCSAVALALAALGM